MPLNFVKQKRIIIFCIVLLFMLVAINRYHAYISSPKYITSTFPKKLEQKKYKDICSKIDDSVFKNNLGEARGFEIFVNYYGPFINEKCNSEFYTYLENYIRQSNERTQILWLHHLSSVGYKFVNGKWIIEKYLAPDCSSRLMDFPIRDLVSKSINKEEVILVTIEKMTNLCGIDKFSNTLGNQVAFLQKFDESDSVKLISEYYNSIVDMNNNLNSPIEDIDVKIKMLNNEKDNNINKINEFEEDMLKNESGIAVSGTIDYLKVNTTSYGRFGADIIIKTFAGPLHFFTSSNSFSDLQEGDKIDVIITARNPVEPSCFFAIPDDRNYIKSNIRELKEKNKSIDININKFTNKKNKLNDQIQKAGGLPNYRIEKLEPEIKKLREMILLKMKTLSCSDCIKHERMKYVL